MKSRPYPPIEPRKPSKVKEINFYVSYKNPISDKEIRLADVEIPEGCSLKNAVIDITASEYDFEYEFIFTKEEENLAFDEQIEKYNKYDYPRYLIALENYKLELIQWDKEQEEYKSNLLKNQLDAAEALLKKHGRL